MKNIIGHKNPDTDSVVSAIVYSDFLNKTGDKAQPFVLGLLNNETIFVLDKFRVNPPGLVDD